MRLLLLPLLVVLLQAPQTQPAKPGAARPDCYGADMDQASLNICVAQVAKIAETELVATYEQFAKLLTGNNRANLIASQKAWVVYRDAECHAVAGTFDGGSMMPMQYSGCRAAMADERDKEIQDTFDDAAKSQ